MDHTLLEKKIMRRVCWSCYLRRAINPFMVKIYALVAILVSIISTVSVANIIENTAHITNIAGLYSFYASAFANTEVIVQALVVGGAVLLLWVLKDTIIPKMHFA